MLTPSRRALLLSALASPLGAKAKFTQSVGLQLYSLRRQAARDLPGTLALVRELGFRDLEAGSFFGRTPAEFQGLLAARGLKVSSMGAEWDRLTASTAEVAGNALTLGAGFISCTSIPRRRRAPLTPDDIARAADNFNRWGADFARAGLRFCYHPHGPEFIGGPDGTLFDTLARRTDPRAANFEMDVFWFVFGNQDPAAMLERYKGRFLLMHVKDIRHGEPRTFDPGTVAEEASVPLGTGEVDWPAVLGAALKARVQHYYIEEEHPDAAAHIRQSLAYLDTLRI